MPDPVTHGHEYLRRVGSAAANLEGHPRKVAFVPGQAILAVLCSNGRLRLVPLKDGKEISVSVGTAATVLRAYLATSPKGDFVLAGRFCVDPMSGKTIWSAKPKESWAESCAMVVAPDGKTAFAGCYRLNAATGKQVGYLADTNSRHVGGPRPVTASAISQDGKILATGDGNGNVVLTSVAARHGSVLAGGYEEEESATQGFLKSIDGLAFGRDWLAAGGEGTEVRLLSPRDLSLVRSLPIIEARASATRVPWAVGKASPETRGLVFAPDGMTLVAATLEPGRKTGHVRVWNAKTGKERMRVALDAPVMTPGGLLDLAVSEDGSTIALALSTGAYVCDMPRG